VTLTDALLALFGVLAVATGVGVVTTASVVRAGLWLVASLAAVAACFLVLAAEFLAWAQLLVYAGAVIVLLLFATALTRSPTARDARRDRSRGLPALVALGAGGGLIAFFAHAFGGERVSLPESAVAARTLGELLFGEWILAFELLSLLLLAALVAALVLRTNPAERRG
jgi:NADH-quinone oxidoreductase subunit J